MKIERAIEVLGDEGYEVRESSVVKNGIEIPCLRFEGLRLSPTLYYSYIESLDSDDELMEGVENAFASAPAIEDIDSIISADYILDNVFSCIRHQSPDMDAVKYSVYGDLEEYFRVPVGSDGSYVLLKDHLERLNLNSDTIREAARNNLKKTATIRTMSSVINEMMGASTDVNIPDIDDVMFVASNKNKWHGASVMLLDDVLRDFCISRDIDSLYIVPSSKHEVLLLTEGEENFINQMINEVNSSEVAEDDQLSDHCYRFVA